jgi:hypothetical protein
MTGAAASSTALASFLERLDLLGGVDPAGVDAAQAQRALDGDLRVAEGGVGEDLRLLGFLEGRGRSHRCASMSSGVSSQFFLPEVLAQGLEPRGGVDELHLALAVGGLAVGDKTQT